MSLKHALLAMIDIENSSGYDLTKQFEKGVGNFWPASFQQIYRDLQTLDDQGWVESETIKQSGKPDKKIYSITTAGIEELESWLKKPAKDMKAKEPLLIKIFAGKRLNSEELIADINLQFEKHTNKLRQYQQTAEILKSLPEPRLSAYRLPFETLKLGIKIESAWLEWAKAVQETITKEQD